MPDMTHPDLPGQTITVTDRAATIHARKGWVAADHSPEGSQPEDETPPASEPVDTDNPDSEEE